MNLPCSHDWVNGCGGQDSLVYMRERLDKDIPNASRFYDKENPYEKDRVGLETPAVVQERIEARHLQDLEQQRQREEEYERRQETQARGNPGTGSYCARSPPYYPADDPDLDGPYPIPEYLLPREGDDYESGDHAGVAPPEYLQDSRGTEDQDGGGYDSEGMQGGEMGGPEDDSRCEPQHKLPPRKSGSTWIE
eukprot:gene1427-32799_t